MLRTKLLTYILCYMCTPSTTIDGVNFALGSTLSWSMFCNWLQPKQSTQKIKSLHESFADFQFGKHQIIIPDIIPPHFHVIDVSIDFKSANVITPVEYYDLMNTSVNAKNKKVRTFMESMINVLNEFPMKHREWFCVLVQC